MCHHLPPQIFHTASGTEVRLTCKKNDSSLEFCIENLSYRQQRNGQIKRLFMQIVCFGFISTVLLPYSILVSVGLVAVVCLQIYSLLNLVCHGELVQTADAYIRNYIYNSFCSVF